MLNALDYSVEMIWLLSPGLQANCSHWLQWCALPFNLGAPNTNSTSQHIKTNVNRTKGVDTETAVLH